MRRVSAAMVGPLRVSASMVSPATGEESSCDTVASARRVVSLSEAGDDPEPLTISTITLRFSATRMELAFREQLSEIILDGLPSEACWLVVGSALGYANFVLDAFETGQTLAAVIPLTALGLAAVLATPVLCLQGLFDRSPSRVLALLASCASVLLLACPLATSLLCITTPCGAGEGWRLAAAAQDGMLVVSVLSALFAGLPMLHGCLPALMAVATQAVVLLARRDTLIGEYHMASLRRGSCLLLLLLLVVFGVRRREVLDRAVFLTAEGGVELQMALLQQPVSPLPATPASIPDPFLHTPPFCPSPPPSHSRRMCRPIAQVGANNRKNRRTKTKRGLSLDVRRPAERPAPPSAPPLPPLPTHPPTPLLMPKPRVIEERACRQPTLEHCKIQYRTETPTALDAPTPWPSACGLLPRVLPSGRVWRFGALPSTRRHLPAPQMQSMRSVHLSSPMEQAIQQMRTLLRRVSAIEGATSRRPALMSTPLRQCRRDSVASTVLSRPLLRLQDPRGGIWPPGSRGPWTCSSRARRARRIAATRRRRWTGPGI